MSIKNLAAHIIQYRERYLWLLLTLVFVVSYFRVPFIFFQQDEIFSFGVFTREGTNTLKYFLELKFLDHLTPITTSLSYFLYSFWGLNYQLYNILGLLVHLVNGLLVYKIAMYIFRKRYLATLTSIIFLAANQAHEIVMWPVASLNTLSLTFSLLAIGIVVKKITSADYLTLRDNLLILLFFLCGVFSIEYAVSLILFIPLMVLVLSRSKKRALLSLTPFGLVVAIYLLWRFAPVLLSSKQSLGTTVGGFERVKRIFTLPVLYFGQLFLGQDIPLAISRKIFSIYYKNNQNFQFAEVVIYKYVTAFFSTIIFGALTVIYLKARSINPKQAKYILLFFFFIIFNALPFILVPGSGFLFSIVPSRYLYFGLVSYAFLLVLVFDFLKGRNKPIRLIMYVMLFGSITFGVMENYVDSLNLYSTGRVRLGILKNIKNLHPKLFQKTVFYTESDTSFYGLPPEERILPFQSGLGQTLLIWYQAEEKFPVDFFKNRFLWEMKDQGYREFEGRGFGYFRDFNKIAQTVAEGGFDLTDIIGFRFDSLTNKIYDNTNEIRGRVAGYLVEKELVSSNEFSLIASENNKEIFKAVDGIRKTFWRSSSPYSFHQSLIIQLHRPRNIAEIVIDSYNDIDQNEVGYAVFESEDEQSWKEVFFSKRYPPDKTGLLEIYFQPNKVKYIKIEQVGEHKYASWVINELRLYESKN